MSGPVQARELPVQVRRNKKSLLTQIIKYRYLFLLMLPGMVYFLVFRYGPFYGVILAFKNFRVADGILGSAWADPWYKYFRQLFTMQAVGQVVFNTIRISFLKIVTGFPAPIILALLLNELRHMAFKRIVQTISYLPHFLSWVVVAGLVIEMLSPSRGPIAYFLSFFGIRLPMLLTSKTAFIPVLLVSEIWKGIGWGTIIYLATLANIDPQLYDAAKIDGASRFQQVRHITIPGLVPVMTILLILNMGQILNAGFDQIFNLYNPLVYEVADIIDTYIYRIGLVGFQYSFSTAVGISKNIVAFGLVFGTNFIVKRFSEYTIW